MKHKRKGAGQIMLPQTVRNGFDFAGGVVASAVCRSPVCFPIGVAIVDKSYKKLRYMAKKDLMYLKRKRK